MNHGGKYNLIFKRIAKYLFLLLLFLLPICAKAATTVTLGSSVKAISVEILDGNTLDVNGSNAITLTGSGSPFDVRGTFTASTGTVLYAGSSATTIASLSADNHYYNLTMGAASDNNTILFSVNGEIEASGSITVTNGGSGTHTFTQGNNNITAGGASAVTVGANATWNNIGTGDLTLGGTFANSGTVVFNTSNNGCTGGGIADDIAITSSAGGTQRNWTSSSPIEMYNVSVTDMTSSADILAYSSTFSNVGPKWALVKCSDFSTPYNRIKGDTRIKGGTRIK